MKLSETRFPAFWDIYEPIFLTLESVQKTYFLSLITIHNIANPKIMVWQPVVFHNLQYQLLMTTLMYLSHAIDCQKECQNQQINHFKAINVSTIMQSCVDACGKAAKKHPTYLLKKKKNPKHTWISYSHHQHLRQHLRHNLCWAGTDVGMMKRSMWYNHRLQNKHNMHMQQIRLNNILHS